MIRNRYVGFMTEEAREFHANSMALRKINVAAMKKAAEVRDARRRAAEGLTEAGALLADFSGAFAELKWAVERISAKKDGG